MDDHPGVLAEYLASAREGGAETHSGQTLHIVAMVGISFAGHAVVQLVTESSSGAPEPLDGAATTRRAPWESRASAELLDDRYRSVLPTHDILQFMVAVPLVNDLVDGSRVREILQTVSTSCAQRDMPVLLFHVPAAPPSGLSVPEHEEDPDDHEAWIRIRVGLPTGEEKRVLEFLEETVTLLELGQDEKLRIESVSEFARPDDRQTQEGLPASYPDFSSRIEWERPITYVTVQTRARTGLVAYLTELFQPFDSRLQGASFTTAAGEDLMVFFFTGTPRDGGLEDTVRGIRATLRRPAGGGGSEFAADPSAHVECFATTAWPGERGARLQQERKSGTVGSRMTWSVPAEEGVVNAILGAVGLSAPKEGGRSRPWRRRAATERTVAAANLAYILVRTTTTGVSAGRVVIRTDKRAIVEAATGSEQREGRGDQGTETVTHDMVDRYLRSLERRTRQGLEALVRDESADRERPAFVLAEPFWRRRGP